MCLQFLYPNVFEADGASTKRGLHFKNGSYVAFVSFRPKDKKTPEKNRYKFLHFRSLTSFETL